MCYVSMSIALTQLWRHSETALCRNHGNRSVTGTQTSEHKCVVEAECCRVAGVEGRRVAGVEGRRVAAVEGRRVAAVEGRRVAAVEGRRVAGVEGRRVVGVEGRRVAGVEGRRVAAVEGRRVAAVEGRRVAAVAACTRSLRVEPRTFKTAPVFILVTDCLHFQRQAALSPSVCRFCCSYFSGTFRTLPCSAPTRGPMLQRADCSLTGLSVCLLCTHALGTFANSTTSICLLKMCSSELMLVLIDVLANDFLFHRELLIKYVCLLLGLETLQLENRTVFTHRNVEVKLVVVLVCCN